MKRLRAHLIGIEEGQIILFSDFSDGGEMWTGVGPRERRKKISFSEPFTSPPSVRVNISLWDMDTKANTRADLSAEKITEEHFELTFRTWGDSKIARIHASWLAIGEVDDKEAMWDLY